MPDKTTVTERGQTTIPARLRHEHHVKPGMELIWEPVGPDELMHQLWPQNEALAAPLHLAEPTVLCPTESTGGQDAATRTALAPAIRGGGRRVTLSVVALMVLLLTNPSPSRRRPIRPRPTRPQPQICSV